MPRETYKNFQRQFAASRPYGEIFVEKALACLNRGSQERPYEITRTHHRTNYNLLRYDAELNNGEESIIVEPKTDHGSRETGNFFVE